MQQVREARAERVLDKREHGVVDLHLSLLRCNPADTIEDL